MKPLAAIAGLVLLVSTLGQQAPVQAESLDVDSLKAGRIVLQENGKAWAELGDINTSHTGSDALGLVFLDEDGSEHLFVTLDRQGLKASRIERNAEGEPVQGSFVWKIGASVKISQFLGAFNFGIDADGPNLRVNHDSWWSTFDLLELRGGDRR